MPASSLSPTRGTTLWVSVDVHRAESNAVTSCETLSNPEWTMLGDRITPALSNPESAKLPPSTLES